MPERQERPILPDPATNRLERLLAVECHRPLILGLVGPPGSGKTTVAQQVQQHLEARGTTAAILAMDGFHLANGELTRLGRRDRKGAPDTFDADGYVHALRRIHAGESIFAPVFERQLDAAIAAGTWIDSRCRIVITEGNYLLLDTGPWAQVRGLLDEAWYLDANAWRDQLIDRHIFFGRSPAQAQAWVTSVDEPNARLIAASRHRADHHLTLAGQ